MIGRRALLSLRAVRLSGARSFSAVPPGAYLSSVEVIERLGDLLGATNLNGAHGLDEGMSLQKDLKVDELSMLELKDALEKEFCVDLSKASLTSVGVSVLRIARRTRHDRGPPPRGALLGARR